MIWSNEAIGVDHRITWLCRHGKRRYTSDWFTTSTLEGSGCSASRPDRFTPGKGLLPVVQKAGWVIEPVWIKGKAIPLQARTGPEGSRWLRLLDFKTFDT